MCDVYFLYFPQCVTCWLFCTLACSDFLIMGPLLGPLGCNSTAAHLSITALTYVSVLYSCPFLFLPQGSLRIFRNPKESPGFPMCPLNPHAKRVLGRGAPLRGALSVPSGTLRGVGSSSIAARRRWGVCKSESQLLETGMLLPPIQILGPCTFLSSPGLVNMLFVISVCSQF